MNKYKYIDYKYDAKAIIIADADIVLHACRPTEEI
jgi:hypothetical protein